MELKAHIRCTEFLVYLVMLILNGIERLIQIFHLFRRLTR